MKSTTPYMIISYKQDAPDGACSLPISDSRMQEDQDEFELLE
jgi:hypothetical protein